MWTARNRFILVMLIASGMLNYADRQTISVLKPLLQSQMHWSDADYGRLASSFQFASAIVLLFSGWVVDRIGWRRANPLAVGGWSLVAMTHALARNLGQFTLARVGLGAAEAFATPTNIKTIAAVFRNEERSMALGVMSAIGGVAGAVVIPIGLPWLALRVGWANTFLITGGLGLVWAAVWTIGAGRGPSGHGERTVAPARIKVPILTVLTDRRTWTIAGAKVLSDQVFWLMLFWTPDLFHRVFHLSMAQYGAPVAIASLGAALGSLMGGVIPTKMLERGFGLNRTRKTALLVSALLVTPLWLVLLAPNYWVAAGILFVTNAAHQSFSTNTFALATDITPTSRVATVVGLGAFSGNLAGTAVLWCAGQVLTAGYGYGPLLGFASVSYLLGVGWVQLLMPKIVAADPDPEPEVA